VLRYLSIYLLSKGFRGVKIRYFHIE